MDAHYVDTAALVDEEARNEISRRLDTQSVSSLARELNINRGLIPYVLKGGHSPTLLKALNMPVYEKSEVPVCRWCGRVHKMHKLCESSKQHRTRHRKCAELVEVGDSEILEDVARRSGWSSWTNLCRFVVARYKSYGDAVIEVWDA